MLFFVEKSSKPTDPSMVVSRIPKSYHRQALLPRTKILKPKQELEWKVKIHDINKLIYNSKHIGKYLPCPTKVAVEDIGNLRVVLQFGLHPFGVEEDENRNVTFEGVIEQPKKHRLHSEAKLSIRVSAVNEKTKLQLCVPREEKRDANLSYFYIKGFISHEQLKESVKRSGNVIVTVEVQMLLPKFIQI